MRVLSIYNDFPWKWNPLIVFNANFTTRKTYSFRLHPANDAQKCNEWIRKLFHDVSDLKNNKFSAFDFLYLNFYGNSKQK